VSNMSLAGLAFRFSISSVVNTPPVLRSPISTLSDSDDPTYHGLIDYILISQLLLSNPARHIPDIHCFALFGRGFLADVTTIHHIVRVVLFRTGPQVLGVHTGGVVTCL